jgi:hydroxymethylbilane synthase
LVLHGVVAAVDGGKVVRLSASAPAIGAERLGRELASDLIAAGAADLLGSAR